jgi:hypothetical protein
MNLVNRKKAGRGGSCSICNQPYHKGEHVLYYRAGSMMSVQVHSICLLKEVINAIDDTNLTNPLAQECLHEVVLKICSFSKDVPSIIRDIIEQAQLKDDEE